MHFTSAFTALAGFTCLAAAAPAPVENGMTPSERGLKFRSRFQRRAPLIIQEVVEEQSITVVESDAGEVDQLERLAEQELGALVQAQIALVQQLETIKNNIRINSFRAQFTNVDTVIVTVTTIVDARGSGGSNKRYLVNQLYADNGVNTKQVVVMVSDAQTMTIDGSQTAGVGGNSVASASLVSQPTGTPGVSTFDPSAPYGQLNSSMILPAGTLPPTLAMVLDDPADIILSDQIDLFVQNTNDFVQDCALFSDAGTLLVASAQIFDSLQAAAAEQLAGLTLGSGPPSAPSGVASVAASSVAPSSTAAASGTEAVQSTPAASTAPAGAGSGTQGAVSIPVAPAAPAPAPA